MSKTQDEYQVSGTLFSQETGEPLAGLEVLAFDRDLMKDQYLGMAKVSDDGSFRIDFNVKQFRNHFLESGPDIYFIVKKGERVVHVSPRVLKANAGKLEHFDLRIPDPIFAGGSLPVSRSAFQTLKANLPLVKDWNAPIGLQGQWTTIFQGHKPTHFEGLTCVGYRPEDDLLEAVIEVKERTGYSGGLCTEGSKEYVAFYVREEGEREFRPVGEPAWVRVHDLATNNGSVYYAVRQVLNAGLKTDCSISKILHVKAILSWEMAPTGPDFRPVWGEVKEAQILLKPQRNFVFDLIPPFHANIPLAPFNPFLPPKFSFQGNWEDFGNFFQAQQAAQSASDSLVPERGQFHALIAENPNYFGQISPAQNLQDLQKDFLKLPGIDLSEIHWDGLLPKIPFPTAIQPTHYEELTCVGFYPAGDLLEAVFSVKQEQGYRGGLCTAGSTEYVAFYMERNGVMEYVGTDRVQVHDIDGISGSLQYAARVVVPNVAERLRPCSEEQIVRVRAILSWSQDPTGLGPDFPPVWGNVLDAKVVLRPAALPSQFKIETVNGIDVDDIDSDGYFRSGPGTPLRPFGGLLGVYAQVNMPGAVSYRLGIGTDNVNWDWSKTQRRRRAPGGAATVISYGGWFSVGDYLNDRADYPLALIGAVNTTSAENGKHFLRLEVADALGIILAAAQLPIYLDNMPPALTVIQGGKYRSSGITVKDGAGHVIQCLKYVGISEIFVYGNFADDHLGGYSLTLTGGNILGGRPIPLLGRGVPPFTYDTIRQNGGTSGAELLIARFSLQEVAGQDALPCAYQIELRVSDRTIVGRWSGYAFDTYERQTLGQVTFNWDIN